MAYKHVIRAKTRNLFDISKVTNYPPTYNVDNLYLKTKPLSVSSIIFLKETLIQLCPNLISGNTYVFNAKTTGKYQQILLNDIVWEFGTARTLTDADLNKTIGLYAEPTNAADEWTIISEIQIEEGSTPTPYTPYNYLQSNKRMIKVSNVCQLYDKTYPVTQTIDGVTFTNNGDGSVTVNGTAPTTKPATIRALPHIKVNPGDKILMFSGYDIGGLKSAFVYISQLDANGKWRADLGHPSLNGRISTCKNNTHYIDGTFRVDRGNTATNAVIKLQIFNLTEMFGAGHEPATVAEFRQRFPNEYYPYSPQCWLTSYKSAVVCKTKNLFDYKTSAEKTQTHNGITLILNTDYFELSGQQQAGKYIELGQSGFNIPFEIGKTYVLSADTIVKSGGKVFMRARYTDGESPLTEWETVSWNLSKGTIAKRFTPTRPGYFDKITFYNASDATPISGDYIIRIQLEQGSTATSYVPYQHL